MRQRTVDGCPGQQGRGSDARSLLDALANHPAIHQRDRGLVEAQRKVL